MQIIRRPKVLALAIALCLILSALGATPGSAEPTPAPSPERFRATAVSVGGLMVGGRSAPSGAVSVDLVVERTSSEAERAALLEVLQDGGPGKLWQKLGKMEPVGRIQVRGQLAYDLRYAREVASEDGGRMLILATDRPVAFREIQRNTHSRDYDISVIELHLDAEGKGSGTALPAVQVEYDESTRDISLVQIGTSPVQLTRVRKTE